MITQVVKTQAQLCICYAVSGQTLEFEVSEMRRSLSVSLPQGQSLALVMPRQFNTHRVCTCVRFCAHTCTMLPIGSTTDNSEIELSGGCTIFTRSVLEEHGCILKNHYILFIQCSLTFFKYQRNEHQTFARQIGLQSGKVFLDSQNVQPFAGMAEEELNNLVIKYSQMRTEFGKVTKFFGEDPSHFATDEFFGTFANFMVDFEVSNE